MLNSAELYLLTAGSRGPLDEFMFFLTFSRISAVIPQKPEEIEVERREYYKQPLNGGISDC